MKQRASNQGRKKSKSIVVSTPRNGNKRQRQATNRAIATKKKSKDRPHEQRRRNGRTDKRAPTQPITTTDQHQHDMNTAETPQEDQPITTGDQQKQTTRAHLDNKSSPQTERGQHMKTERRRDTTSRRAQEKFSSRQTTNQHKTGQGQDDTQPPSKELESTEEPKAEKRASKLANDSSRREEHNRRQA